MTISKFEMNVQFKEQIQGILLILFPVKLALLIASGIKLDLGPYIEQS